MSDGEMEFEVEVRAIITFTPEQAARIREMATENRCPISFLLEQEPSLWWNMLTTSDPMIDVTIEDDE